MHHGKALWGPRWQAGSGLCLQNRLTVRPLEGSRGLSQDTEGFNEKAGSQSAPAG